MNPKFIADCMLGKLAKWLRIIGVDILYSPFYRDEEIMAISKFQNRIILTKDSHFLGKKGFNVFLIESDKVEEQVKEVINRFKLKKSLLKRCIMCNEILEKVLRTEIFDYVPEYVYFKYKNFSRCPRCQKIYWEGTHTENIKKQIENW